MNGGRQHPLPRAGLSRNHHVGPGGDVSLETAEEMLQMCTLTDNALPIAQCWVYTPEIVDALHELPNSPLIADSEPGKVKVDVRQVNSLQIESLGISGEQIAIAPYCTYQTPEHFFSYRREQQKKVQWSGIVSFD